MGGRHRQCPRRNGALVPRLMVGRDLSGVCCAKSTTQIRRSVVDGPIFAESVVKLLQDLP